MLSIDTPTVQDIHGDVNISTGFGIEAAEVFGWNQVPSDDELESMEADYRMELAERQLREHREDAA